MAPWSVDDTVIVLSVDDKSFLDLAFVSGCAVTAKQKLHDVSWHRVCLSVSPDQICSDDEALKGARAQVVEPVEFQQTVQQIASTPLQSWTSKLDRKQPNVRGKEPAQQHPENCHFTIVEQLTHGLNPNTKIYFNIRGTPDWIIAAEVDL
jgi:hypothetical protein